MEHLQNRANFLTEDVVVANIAHEKYDEKNLLFLNKSCSAFLDVDEKSMIVATLMTAIGLEWMDFKKWFE